MRLLKRLGKIFFLPVLLSFAASPAFAHEATRTPSTVTYEKVLEYLQLEVKEEKILQMLEASPTQFVLGDAQIQERRQPGADKPVVIRKGYQGAIFAGGKTYHAHVALTQDGSVLAFADADRNEVHLIDLSEFGETPK